MMFTLKGEKNSKSCAPALQDSPHTDPGGPVGRTQSRIDPTSTSRIDPQSRLVDLVDLDPDTGQQEPVDLDVSNQIYCLKYPENKKNVLFFYRNSPAKWYRESGWECIGALCTLLSLALCVSLCVCVCAVAH